MEAELAIAPAAVPREPSTAAGSRTPGAGDQTGNLLGESVPDGVDEPQGPVVDNELGPFVGRGDRFQPAAGHLFRYPSGQVSPRQAEQFSPFSRLMFSAL